MSNSPTTTARPHSPRPSASVLVLDSRLNGPRTSANGGFAAGSIATRIDADTVTVRLERRIPLARGLVVEPDGATGVIVRDRRAVIARAHPGGFRAALDRPAPSEAEAAQARAAHPLLGVRHALSDCVVCGPERLDGMHVTPGPIPGRADMLAAPWIVDSRVAHAGQAQYAAVWGALDCPSYPASALEAAEVCLLGTMTARVMRRPRVGEHLVVYSWTREHHGRRYETSVGMVDAHGDLVARAECTWISVEHPHLGTIARWLS